MKWRHKIEKKQREPKKGDLRTLTKFAWFPIKCSDGFTVWLEKYKLTQKVKWVKHIYVRVGERLKDLGPGLKWCYHKTKSL